MAGMHFDATYNSEPVTKALDKIQKGIYETAKAAELAGGRIDAAFNRISLKGLERIHELMQGFPKEVQGLESFKKQMADLEKRLEQANKKIIELQNQARQPIAIHTNTSEVAKETFAYDSLLESLNDILGARGQNISAILQEQNAIKLNQRELQVLAGIEGKGLKLSDAQQTRRIQLTNSIMQHKQAVSSLQQVVSNEIKLEESAKGSMGEMNQSLGRMRMAYRQLTEQERNSKFGQDLLKNIQGADAQIKQLDATIGNHARNIGDYKQQWNGLNMGIQQVAREMPSLAYGPKIFFSAISNNLPILADELKRAKNEFNALKAEGKNAIPVWKQVATSLFSWQTALTVGVTLLTLYGDKLVKWVSSAMSAKSATDLARESAERLNQVRIDSLKNAQEEITKLNLLYSTATNTNKSMKERLSAVKEMKEEYPAYLSNLKNEDILAGNAAGTYEKLKNKILEVASARASFDKIVENNKKIFDLENDIKDSINPDKSFWGWLDENAPLFSKNIVTFGLRLKQIKNNVASTKAEIESLKGENSTLASGINQSDLSYDYGKQNYSKQESAASNSSDTLRAQQEKYSLLMDKQKLDRKRLSEDLENQATQAEIDALSDGFEKIQAQRDLNNKKEIQALERQKEDYIRTIIQAEKEKFDTQEDINKANDPKHVKKTFDTSTVKVDASKYDRIIENTKTSQGLNEWEQREASMNEYLIKYGTFSQKKEAIDKKYRDAIEKEADLGKKNTLQKEWEESLANLDLSKLKQDINWEMIFGDLSKVTKDQLIKIKSQLQEFKKSPEFQNATPEQIQVIEGAINSINNAMVDKGGFFGGMVDSVRELKIATEELQKAEEELVKANKSGTEAQKEEAQKKVNKAKNRQQNAETNVTKSSDKTIDHLTAVGNAIAQLGSSAEMSLSSFGNAAGSIVDAFTEAGSKVGGIVGAIFSILDGIQQQGFDKFIGNILESVAGAALSAATFGLVKIGADYSHYNEMKEQYEALNDIWSELIDKKKEYIDISYGIEASKAGEEAKQLQQKAIDSYRTLGKERLNSGASVGSHSIGIRINKGMSSEGWDEAKKALGEDFNKATEGRMTGLFDLSTKQLEKLKGEAPTFWAKLDGDVQDYLNNIIKGEEEIEKIQDKVKEQLTQTSFDNVFDSFMDTLMDMDSAAQDFSDDFEEYLRRAVITNMMSPEIQEKLKKWYEDFAEAMNEGTIADKQPELRAGWDKIVEDGISERDELFKTMGWSSNSSYSEESSKRNFASMSQDTGNELNGRFTALQISNEEIKNSMLSMLTGVNLISTTTTANGITLMEIRNLAISSNSYLEDIAGFQKRIVNEFGIKLDNINSGIKQFNGKH